MKNSFKIIRSHILQRFWIRHTRKSDVCMLDDIARRQHHLCSSLLELVCLVMCSVVDADTVARVDQILHDTTTHNAQSNESKLAR